jgi:hypothetical protein
LKFLKQSGDSRRLALVALVILAAFGLAAYTISAVVKVSKGRSNGD